MLGSNVNSSPKLTLAMASVVDRSGQPFAIFTPSVAEPIIVPSIEQLAISGTKMTVEVTRRTLEKFM